MFGTENFVAMEAEVTLKHMQGMQGMKEMVRLVTSGTGSTNDLAGRRKVGNTITSPQNIVSKETSLAKSNRLD